MLLLKLRTGWVMGFESPICLSCVHDDLVLIFDKYMARYLLKQWWAWK